MNQTNSIVIVPETLHQVQQWVLDNWMNLAARLVAALALLFVGRWVAVMTARMLGRLLERRQVDGTIVSFVRNIASVAMTVFVLIAVLGTLGIPTASFVAVLGAAGLAVGLALQGSLSNFAAGFLLILFRPFKKGDFIDAAGTSGLVEEMQIFSTILNTPDNKRVIIPNAKLTADRIINFSTLPTRRVDLTFGVSYSDDLRKVKEVLRRVVTEDPRVLPDPAPRIAVVGLGDSSVNFTVRVWVNAPDFWDVTFDLNEKVKLTFDAEGITIPFPQRVVHMQRAGE